MFMKISHYEHYIIISSFVLGLNLTTRKVEFQSLKNADVFCIT